MPHIHLKQIVPSARFKSCAVGEIVLPQQILAIIISIRRSHYVVDVLLGRLIRIYCKLCQICW